MAKQAEATMQMRETQQSRLGVLTEASRCVILQAPPLAAVHSSEVSLRETVNHFYSQEQHCSGSDPDLSPPCGGRPGDKGFSPWGPVKMSNYYF